ncbi:MAG: zeta toxin family protein [Proteobacteria bacterium]|nr:zeta toxin family protein [Pseudomonadota bacterium]
MKPILYLIAGANGSGKTTLGRELLREKTNLVFLNTDDIAAKIGDKIGLQSGRAIQEKLYEILGSKKSFVWESTISGVHHLRIIEKARAAKYEIVLIYVFLGSVDLNIARVQKRMSMGGHKVSETDIRRRFQRSILNFPAVKKLADHWELYYNGDDNYELVARGADGFEETIDEDKLKKFKAIK